MATVLADTPIRKSLMRKRLTASITAAAIAAAAFAPSALAVTGTEQTLRQEVSQAAGVPKYDVYAIADGGYSFWGYWCKSNDRETSYAGIYWSAGGRINSTFSWTAATSIPCNHYADQQPF